MDWRVWRVMANGENGVWVRWAVGAALTLVLAGAAAYGGMRAGLSEARAQMAATEAWQQANTKRLDRIEDKLDRLMESGRFP